MIVRDGDSQLTWLWKHNTVRGRRALIQVKTNREERQALRLERQGRTDAKGGRGLKEIKAGGKPETKCYSKVGDILSATFRFYTTSYKIELSSYLGLVHR